MTSDMTVTAIPSEADGEPLFFGLWDEPRECEPAHGMLLRVAHLNGLPSTQLVAFQADIEGRNLRPDECLRLMLRHPMAGAAALAFDTPKVVGKQVELRGHLFRKRDWSIKFRRHCPGCLAESSHHRNWWDLTFMTVCPLHGLPIVGGRGEEVAVGWSATNMAWSGERQLAADFARRVETPLRNLESFLLGALGAAPALASPLLDGHAPADVVQAVRRLGALSLAGWSETKPRVGHGRFGKAAVTAAGFAAADAGPEGVARLLARIRDGAPPVEDPRAELGVLSMFGWGFKEFRESANPILGSVADSMVEMAVADGRIRRSKSLLADRTDAFGRMTMKEVAAATGIPRAEVPAMAKRHLPGFGRNREGSRVFLDAKDVEVLEKALEGIITRSAAAKRLGVSAAVLRTLEERGLMAPFARRKRDGWSRDRFRIEVIDGLISRALARAGDRKPKGRTVTFDEQARILGVDAAELAVRTVKGEVRAVGLTEGGWGFPSLLFALPDRAGVVRLKDRNRSRVSRDGLAFEEAATYLGLNHSTVAEAVRRRLLAAIDGSKSGTGFRRVTLKALDSFKARFAVGTALAGALGCHPSKVSGKLRKRGIRPVIASVREAAIMAVYRRADLPPELLEAVGGAVSDPFWEFFASAINAARTSFRCPASLKDGEAGLRNNARTVFVRVVVGNEEMSMSTECDPVSSPKRMERLDSRMGLLKDHPTIRVEHSGGGAKLVARLDEFDRADRAKWDGAAEWALGYLVAVTEVFSREASTT